jgi:hypothetical protein
MNLHRAGKARVIPIILRDCMWKQMSFGAFSALPKNPIIGWDNRDAAFLAVAEGIKLVAEEMRKSKR